jgi:hypothetical protein
MIIYPHKPGTGDVYVLHLSSTGNLVDGLRKCGFMTHDPKANVDLIQTGYDAVICGSQEQTDSDSQRRHLLQLVRETLTKKGIGIVSYVPAGAVGMDKEGVLVWTSNPNDNLKGYEK